jgi:hypothetical protein
MLEEWHILFDVNFNLVTKKNGRCTANNIRCEIYHELQKSKGFKGYRNYAKPPGAVCAFIRAAYDFVDPTAEMSANPPLNSFTAVHLQSLSLEPTPTGEYVADLVKIVRAIVDVR